MSELAYSILMAGNSAYLNSVITRLVMGLRLMTNDQALCLDSNGLLAARNRRRLDRARVLTNVVYHGLCLSNLLTYYAVRRRNVVLTLRRLTPSNEEDRTPILINVRNRIRLITDYAYSDLCL